MKKIAIIESTNYQEGTNAKVLKVINCADVKTLEEKFRSCVEETAKGITADIKEMDDEFEGIDIDKHFISPISKLAWEYECSMGDDGDYPLVYTLYLQEVEVED